LDGIKAAVVGVGRLGAQHARVYWQLPGVKLVEVYDIDYPKAERVAVEVLDRIKKNGPSLMGKSPKCPI